jgi:ABC-type uncharacterized transport system auxiliary subunit
VAAANPAVTNLSGIASALGLALAAALGGCAAPASSTGMVPAAYEVAHRHAASVSISVTGGRETGTMDTPQVSNEAFAEAVANAMTRSGVFSTVSSGPDADYRLEIQIFRLQSPGMALRMRANMEVGWTLLNRSTASVIWQESIAAEATATTSDALVGAQRNKMAVEGAAREIIKKAVTRLSQLPLE